MGEESQGKENLKKGKVNCIPVKNIISIKLAVIMQGFRDPTILTQDFIRNTAHWYIFFSWRYNLCIFEPRAKEAHRSFSFLNSLYISDVYKLFSTILHGKNPFTMKSPLYQPILKFSTTLGFLTGLSHLCLSLLMVCSLITSLRLQLLP